MTARGRLSSAIMASGLTQTEVARRLPLSRPLLNRILNGRSQLSPETALKFERLFDLDARRLLVLQLDEQLAIARKSR